MEVADEGNVDERFDGVGGASGEIDGGDGEGLIHGHEEVSGAEDSTFVSEGCREGFAESDAGVFDGVVLVHVEVAFDLEGEVEAAVAGEELQHVIEEADAGGDGVASLPVDEEGKGDVGLGGGRGCIVPVRGISIIALRPSTCRTAR